MLLHRPRYSTFTITINERNIYTYTYHIHTHARTVKHKYLGKKYTVGIVAVVSILKHRGTEFASRTVKQVVVSIYMQTYIASCKS